MAKQWYSLRTNQILKKMNGNKRLRDFMETAIRLMPDHGGATAKGKPRMGMIGDRDWNHNSSGSNPFWIKVTPDNWDYFTTSRLSPLLNAAWDLKISSDRKSATFKIPVDPKAGKPQFVNVRMRKSGKVEETKAGTEEQEKGSAFIFRRALNDNAGWNTWQDIVEDDDTFPELVRIFAGDVPQDWLESYFAQQKVLLEQVRPIAVSEFNHKGEGSGFMDYITDKVLKTKWKDNKPNLGGKKDNWNPADIWIVRGDVNQIKRMIEKTVDGPPGTQTIHELNTVLRRLYKTKHIMGISLKKTGRVAYYDEVNLEGFIPDTKNYNFDVPMKDFIANFDIESGKDMFSQDVKISVNAEREGKTFTFQIKANSSESETGSNLKFEPTMKTAGTARLGKAPVDMVVKILKHIKSDAQFVNKYEKYPKDLDAFNKNMGGKGVDYYERTVLPKLLTGGDKITSDTSTVDGAVKAIVSSYDPKTRSARNTNVRAKLMGLDFFYQVSKLNNEQRNEFITDMVFLAQKKASAKADYFGPFGKIY